MAKKLATINDASITIIQQNFQLAHSGITGRQCPVTKFPTGKYRIRVLKSQSNNYQKGTVSVSWDYFELDKDGLILEAPRGYKKHYKDFKITDLDEYIKNWK